MKKYVKAKDDHFQMKVLPSKEKVRELFDYDQETGIFFWKVKRGSSGIGKRADKPYKGYRTLTIDGISYAAHRIAFAWMGVELNNIVDHENNDRSDNRWSNLKESDTVKNAMNRKNQKVSASGHRSIFERPYKDETRYRVIINRRRGKSYREEFLTLEEAIEARDKFLEEEYG